MHTRLAIAIWALLAGACSKATVTDVETPSSGRLIYLKIDNQHSYLVDPRSHACALVLVHPDGNAMIGVDCQVLAANLPEAAKVITWAPPAPAAAPDTVTPEAPPPVPPPPP